MKNRSNLTPVALTLWLSSIVLMSQTPTVIKPDTNAVTVTPHNSSLPVANLPGDTSQNTKSNAPLREVRPGIFEIGNVRIDKAQRAVSFPAVLNLTQGPMEYFLVTSWGKAHESILRTETDPRQIHVAMLLLGAKAANTNLDSARTPPGEAPLNEGQFVSQPSGARLRGDEITLTVAWKLNGKEIRKRAEGLVLNREKKTVLPPGSWIYNGSRLVDGAFVAEMDGSVVSLITDPGALINNVAPGHEDDAIWMANPNNLPPADVPLEVTIRLTSLPRSGEAGESPFTMDDERTFRLILLVGFMILMPIGVYHRLRARTGEKLDRRQEGLFILVTLRLLGLAAMAGVIAYLINPANMAWAAVPLPAWLRWLGAGLDAIAGALFGWTFRSLGRNLTDTVVTRRQHTLVTRGPYRWVRHPFYSSAALAILANSLLAANGFMLVTGGLIILLLVIRTRKEEENLVARFGDGYREYMKRTGRFVPRIGSGGI